MALSNSKTAPPAAATTAATVSKRPRRPLFPEALLPEPAAPVTSAQPESQPRQPEFSSARSPAADDSVEFQLSASCHLRVDLADLTALPGSGVDLVVVPTNLKLSLEFGLAKAVAGRVRDADSDCRRHSSSLGGAVPFGDTFLCNRSGRGFRKILFIALPNDRRMERQLGSGDSFRRAMDDCLERLMTSLARLASNEGLCHVAMPTLGSNLPLWGGGAHEWAEALAGAVIRLVESGALLGSGPQPALSLHVCCVARDSVQALSGAVARRLPSGGEAPQAQAAAASAESWAEQTQRYSAQPPATASAPPVFDVTDDDDEPAAEAMEVVVPDDRQSGAATSAVSFAGAEAPADSVCVICSEEFSDDRPATPFHCDTVGTQLCSECVGRFNSTEQPTDGKCVLCFQRFRPAVGNQPANGNMLERVDQRHLPGYDNVSTIVVKYTFPSGTHNGTQYKSIARDAFFPNNEQGRSVVQRLRAAFNGRVVFQLGQSATTGNRTAITWNTLHHKTRVDGGPASHGYPDSAYLKRISDELSALGY